MPAEQPAGPGRILFFQQGSGPLRLIDPDGKKEQTVGENQPEFSPSDQARLSPDGQRVAFLVFGGEQGKRKSPPRKVYVRGLDKGEPVNELFS